MESASPEENYVFSSRLALSIIRDVIILFRLNKLEKEQIMLQLRNIFRLEKQNKAVKDKIVRNIRNQF